MDGDGRRAASLEDTGEDEEAIGASGGPVIHPGSHSDLIYVAAFREASSNIIRVSLSLDFSFDNSIFLIQSIFCCLFKLMSRPTLDVARINFSLYSLA